MEKELKKYYTPEFEIKGLGSLPKADEVVFEALPQSYPMPPVLPKQNAHPRLLFQKDEVVEIKKNLSAMQNRCAAFEVEELLQKGTDGCLPTAGEGKSNSSGKVLAIIEAMAFDYAINDNHENGLNAIAAIKNYMESAQFAGIFDYSRPIGHIIFVVAEVYDWCYPLLTGADKKVLIAACEKLAGQMEIGYPPTEQGAVVGHAGEAQLLRDLLGFGIAVYDERPDIYHFCAGRLYAEFVEPRNYWGKSHTHHQGSSYGHYRYYFDLWAQWIIYKMSGTNLFDKEYGKVPYEWIYIRRPDGQMLRIGDEFGEGKLRKGQYWDEVFVTLFMAANYYDDPYLKQECIRESEGFSRFIYENATVTPVHYLLLNKPNLWGEPLGKLPYTKYFGSPAGVMIARSGWKDDVNTDKAKHEDINSDTVLAYMRIGELYAANHHHLDAGNFQLYYKGILASESGYYEAYYTPHDKCYNKETIAHNTFLVYDPDEVVEERPNVGGQRRPVAGEPRNMEIWMKDGAYETGKVLAHQFGPDEQKPEYSYISGDIAKAYTDKVSELLRSMLFMPIDRDSFKGVLFVADKVTAAKPEFKKTFLLHFQQEPQVDGNVTFVENTDHYHRGAMQVHTLLPHGTQPEKIGGEGKEFLINGENYALLEPVDPALAIEAGAWRIEVSPKAATNTDCFLHVLLVGELETNESKAKVSLIENESLMGAQVFDRVCVFHKNAERISDRVTFETLESDAPLKVAVAGIEAGEWSITVDGIAIGTSTATKDGGIVYFDAPAGKVELVRG